MRWIGLSGKMAAGKDYTFRQLQEVDVSLTRVSFADQLRYELEGVFGQALPAVWQKPYSEPIRRLLQWYGTEFRRAEDPDYWVKLAENEALLLPAATLFPVFTDVRFPNEANMIREHGGLIVRVWAPESARRYRLQADPPEHKSETAMDDEPFDLIVNSTVDDSVYRRDLARLLRAARE